MADSKVTDLTAATSVNSADVLYLIQSNADKKVSISTLLANLPATLTKFSGLLALGGTTQTLANSGAINITSTTTYISNTGNASLTIADGTYDGQLKIIICTSATATSTLTSNIGAASVQFSEPGHSVILMYRSTDSQWYVLGGTATVNF